MNVSNDAVMYGAIAAVVVTVIIIGFIASKVISLMNSDKKD